MRIPVVAGAAVDEFDEADATFGHAAADETLPAESFGGPSFQAVEVESGVAFLGEVENLWCLHLHAKGGGE